MDFKLYHLLLEKKNFLDICTIANDNALTVEIILPDYDVMLALIHKVGGPSNWHLRREYAHSEALVDLHARIFDPESRLYLFKESQEIVGFCQVLNTPILRKKFSSDPRNIVEIYKVGLFPEHIGKGLGRYFISMVLRDLFDHQGYDAVYLNTRSTNKVNSVPFYERMGFHLLDEETKPDDLMINRGSVPV